MPQTSLRGGSGWGAFSSRDRRARVRKALDASVLDVFGNGEQARFDHEGAQPAASVLLPEPHVLGECRAERPAADNEHVEGTATAPLPRVDLGDVVAEISPLDILRERSPLRYLQQCDSPCAGT